MRDSLSADTVTAAHFDRAMKETRPSVTPEMERDYEQMLRTLKQQEPRQRIGFRIGESE